jgi:hypothetical protein
MHRAYWKVGASVAVVATLTGCDDGCAHSETIVWIPKDRAPTVALATAIGGCGLDTPLPYDGGIRTYYFVEKNSSGEKCQVIVQFNDGSPKFETYVPIDSNGCLLPQPIHVPEK